MGSGASGRQITRREDGWWMDNDGWVDGTAEECVGGQDR